MISKVSLAAVALLLAAPGVAFAQNSIASGQTLRGSLSVRDVTMDDGSYYRCYSLQTRAGIRYRVEMRSERFDAYLGVGKGCPEGERTDDDGAGGTDSRIDFTGDGQVWLIRANSLSAGDTGQFTLSVVERGAAPMLRTTGIDFGQTLQGSLAESDAVAEDGSFYDCYVFAGRRDQAVVVDLQSGAFDAYASLHQGAGCDGEPLASNDDSDGGTNAKIEATLTIDGPWSFRANSFSSGGVGTYTVSLGDLGTQGLQNFDPAVAYFDASSDDLTVDAREQLDAAARRAISAEGVVVTIAGHANRAEGSPDQAVGLSQRRANRARDYLVSRGVPDGVIVTEAFGSTRPAVDGAKAEPRNRRVEITFGPGSGW